MQERNSLRLVDVELANKAWFHLARAQAAPQSEARSWLCARGKRGTENLG